MGRARKNGALNVEGMAFETMHPQDVKAAIRKQFGSVQAFERREALPLKSVHDLLRGRRSQRVADAVERVIGNPGKSENSDGSREDGAGTHHRNSPRLLAFLGRMFRRGAATSRPNAGAR